MLNIQILYFQSKKNKTKKTSISQFYLPLGVHRHRTCVRSGCLLAATRCARANFWAVDLVYLRARSPASSSHEVRQIHSLKITFTWLLLKAVATMKGFFDAERGALLCVMKFPADYTSIQTKDLPDMRIPTYPTVSRVYDKLTGPFATNPTCIHNHKTQQSGVCVCVCV